MAVTAIREKTGLSVEFSLGIIDGKQKFTRKTYNNVKEDAENQNLYSTGVVLGQLSAYDVTNYKVSTQDILLD